MTNQMISGGNYGVYAAFSTNVKSDSGTVKPKRDHIQVKTGTEQTRLGQYREQGVDLELSGNSGKFTEEELEAMKQSEAEKSLRASYQEQLESAKEAAEGMGEGFEDMGKAMEIARRLMHGDIVPPSDEKFLMDFDKDIYLSAKSMQVLAQNKNAKEYDSLLEEEESEGAVDSKDGDIVIDASGLKLCREMMPASS